MNIGSIIRKYRKEAGLTQEAMADRLGVTTPAVNKWENGNSNPDIELLAPIARLLHISLDTLMSFQEELSSVEIEEIIRQMDKMFETEGFDRTYEWALEKIQNYPNCNMLIWQMAVILDARRITGDCAEPEKYDEQINSWYEMALHDKNEEVQHHAADSLFGFYLRKKEYHKAEEYLQYFSDHDPVKKIYLGRLYKEQDKTEDAYEMFESVLLSEYQVLNFAFSFMMGLAIQEKDMEHARFLAKKMGALAGIFDMGKYNECSAMLDVVCAEKNIEGTCQVAEQLLQNVDSLFDFSQSKLFRHMKFKSCDRSFRKEIKGKLLEGFRNEDDFGYMSGYDAWEKLVGKEHY